VNCFLFALLLFIGALTHVDRIYFKRSHSFCVHFLYSALPSQAEWNLPPITQEEGALLDAILSQKFHYLAKGTHAYAFLSEDGKYVIKFHRYASHMRRFAWVSHPLRYTFSAKRQKIKEYNMRKVHAHMKSYRASYMHLKEESGLVCLHISRTEDTLRRTVTLVDATQAQYQVPLDEVTFILQHRAELIYPTLKELKAENRLEEAKQIISNILHLIQTTCQKGYIDEDPVLSRNYGLLADRAIHIDLGSLVQQEQIALRENYIPYVKEVTAGLCKYLEQEDSELLAHYHAELYSLGRNSLN